MITHEQATRMIDEALDNSGIYTWILFAVIPGGLVLQLVVDPSVKVVAGKPFTNPNSLFVALLVCMVFVSVLAWLGVVWFIRSMVRRDTERGRETVFDKADRSWYRRTVLYRMVALMATPTAAGGIFGFLYYYKSGRWGLSLVFYALGLAYFVVFKLKSRDALHSLVAPLEELPIAR